MRGADYNRMVHISQPANQRQEFILIGIGLAFGWTNALSLWLQSHRLDAAIAALLLSALAVAMHLWLNRVAANRDPYLLPVAVFLTIWGLQIIARVAPNFLLRQVVWIAVGAVALSAVAASRDRLRWLRRYKYTWLLASLLLLAATLLLGVNPTGVGARRWLSIAGVFLQPSEVLRLLMIAFLAAFYSERLGLERLRQSIGLHLDTNRWQHGGQALLSGLKSLAPLAPSFLMWLIALALQATQQDIGASALLLITYAFMLYLATGKAALPALGLGLLGLAIAVGYFFSSLIALRINIWLNPWIDPQGSAFQIVQSLIAVANGGIFGQGPGQGRPIYIPAVHTDFPFAAIGEEYGFIGALGLILLFTLLSYRAWRIARNTHSAYILLLAGGLAVLLTTQVFVIVAGNLAVIPLTGVTVPFVSYGGSSLLVSFISIGLLIRLSCDGMPAIPATGAYTITQPASSDRVLQVTPKQLKAAEYGFLISLGMMMVLGIASAYWGVVQSATLISRPDNPRKVDVERAIDRGPILARDGTKLVYSQLAESAAPYSPPVYTRVYPVPAAAPVVGYYSLWHGIGGVEAYADLKLRGSANTIDRLLHHQQIGQPFTTTISLPLQQKVAAVMSGTTGSAVIMDWHSGQVLALVSTPIFDPSTLDADWDQLRSRADAPLLNRATQGLYQPGSLLQWFYDEDRSQSGPRMSLTNTWDSTDRFRLGHVVPFQLDNAAVPYPASATYSETIGQGTLRITPLRAAVTVARLASGHTVTPTIEYDGSTSQPSLQLSSQPRMVHTTTAVIGPGKFVAWYASADDNLVVVLAIESTSASTTSVTEMARRIRTP